jgi:hypothetical protein
MRVSIIALAFVWIGNFAWKTQGPPDINETLAGVLAETGFTGTIQDQLTDRIGRPIDQRLADLGRQTRPSSRR